MNKKNLTSVLAASVLSLSLGGQLFAAGAGFGDLNGIPGQAKIQALKNQDLVKGMSAASFQPQSVLTNAQGIQLISGGLQLSLAAVSFEAGKVPTASDLFPSLKDNAWYAEAFINAYFNGVEIPENIDPAAPMTKEAYIHYLMQAVEKSGNLPLIKIQSQPIGDEDELTAAYKGSIHRALHYGLIELDGKGELNPKSRITRSEAAVLLYDVIEFLKNKSGAPSSSPDMPENP